MKTTPIKFKQHFNKTQTRIISQSQTARQTASFICSHQIGQQLPRLRIGQNNLSAHNNTNVCTTQK